MPSKLPRLLSARQVAEVLGKSVRSVQEGLRRGRFTRTQYVSGLGYVIAEDFRIRPVHFDDALTDGLPDELISDEPMKDFSALTEKPIPIRNPSGEVGHKKIGIPGFKRIKQERQLGAKQVYRLTGVHDMTQAKILKGEKVHPTVLLRLAKGLEIEPDELLRHD